MEQKSPHTVKGHAGPFMEINSVRWRGEEAPAPDQAYILVVEDELFVRMFISDALRDAGYRVLEAFNGDEAVEILDSGAHVDLVLSDVRCRARSMAWGCLRL